VRVAYVCADAGIPVFGQKGCSIHVQEVIRSLLKKNVEVSLFTTCLGDKIPSEFQEVNIYSLPTIPKVEKAVRERVALSINPDLALELKMAEPFDCVYERYSLWSYSGMEYAKKAGITGILEVNAPLIVEQDRHRGLVYREEAEAVAKKLFNDATIIIAVSREIKDYIAQYVTNTDKIKVIPNGVNPQRFSTGILKEKSSSAPFTAGFLGSLKPWHGLSILVDGFAQFHHSYPNTRLLIVGDGTERESLLQAIKAKNLESSVILTGSVAPDEVSHWLSQMDVAVAPYPYLEDFYFSPLKIYEYMAMGLPVIASNIGQLTEIIEDGVNGLLSNAGDSRALASHLERLYNDSSLRRHLGNKAKETILNHHTWDRVVEEILGLVKQEVTSLYRFAEVKSLIL
jgi:glycosyltransferase involved in cell wall biosynthesis